MLAYAADRPLTGKRQSSPHAMLLIVSAHVALLAAAMSVKMELAPPIDKGPITVDFIKDPPPPPPNKPLPKQPVPQPQPLNHWIDHPKTQVPIPVPELVPVDTSGTTTNPIPIIAAGTAVFPELPKTVVTAPVRRDARLITPPWDLKPPYPASKQASGEEASLTLRVSIDERGRVTAVEPVGAADRVFLEAARGYMVAHWRYQPAMEDGHAVPSTTVISLRFQLDA
ncbi:MAG TPA: energy transducer TonB [Sphingomicrobium sp.]